MPDPQQESAGALQGVSEAMLRDPLTELTRKGRNRLLLASVIGILIASTGLVPTKIEALGVEFSPSERSGLLYALQGILFYFSVEFLIYAWSDYQSWYNSIYASILAVRRAMREANPEADVSVGPPQLRELPSEIKLRLLVDFLLPPTLALLAMSLLFLRAVRSFP